MLKLTIFQRSGPKFCIFTTVFFNFSIQNTISLKVTFPAVYICNLNQITKTFLKNTATDDGSELTERVILSQFLDGNKNPLATEEERIFFENMKNAMELKYGWENTSDITTGMYIPTL